MGNYPWLLMNSRSDFVYLTKNMHIPSSVASCKDGITASASATGTKGTGNSQMSAKSDLQTLVTTVILNQPGYDNLPILRSNSLTHVFVI